MAMEAGIRRTWKGQLIGAAVPIIYALSYLLTWRLSTDQWYLPAGIRVASLLFIPTRFWPYLFIGEFGALLYLRLPMVEKYGLPWVLIVAALYMPIVSGLIHALQRRLGRVADREYLLPAVAAAVTVFGAGLGTAFNTVLMHPKKFELVPHNVLKAAVGDYLGMLMISLAALLVVRRVGRGILPGRLWRDALPAFSVVAGLTYLARMVGSGPDEIRQGLLLLMLAPPVALTLMHGWRGAALGVIMVNIGIAAAMPKTNHAGAFDAQAFVAQEALAVAGTALFLLGSIISKHYRKARDTARAEREAFNLARNSFAQHERGLRERALQAVRMKDELARAKHDLVVWLRAHGHHAAAMDVLASSLSQSQKFNSHADALYPIGIEASGLYNVIDSAALSELWGHGVEVSCRLRGNPGRLSVALQLAAYRSICDAVAILSDCVPDEIFVKARSTVGRKQRGIVISVVHKQQPQIGTEAAALAKLDLRSRVQAFGGTIRIKSTNRISILLCEPTWSTDPVSRYSEPGLETDQRAPVVLS